MTDIQKKLKFVAVLRKICTALRCCMLSCDVLLCVLDKSGADCSSAEHLKAWRPSRINWSSHNGAVSVKFGQSLGSVLCNLLYRHVRPHIRRNLYRIHRL